VDDLARASTLCQPATVSLFPLREFEISSVCGSGLRQPLTVGNSEELLALAWDRILDRDNSLAWTL
jgi:hypothetical protein